MSKYPSQAAVAVRAFVAASLVLASLAGCGGSGSSGPKKLRIAVIPKGTSHDFWFSVRAGVERADAEFDDIVVTWKGPTSEGDTADQIKMVESFLADDYAGICLAPVDAVALRRPVDLAVSARVPVVIFDSGLADLNGVVSYVATNNYRGGERAGDYLAQLLGGKGNVILMRYDLTSQSTEQREQGFLDALAKHPDIKLLVADKYAGPLESGAIQLAETLLTQYGDQVDGIFCPNQSTTSGMLTALRRAGLAGKVKFVGFDAGENIAAGLKSGEINGTVLQDPVTMGYDTVRVMRDRLLGKEPPERLETAEALATTENLDDPKIHELLYPPSSD